MRNQTTVVVRKNYVVVLKNVFVAKLPPCPSDNRDATRRGLMFSQREILREADAYRRWPERSLGLAPESQDRVTSGAGRDCSS